jgi:hypothetical protein
MPSVQHTAACWGSRPVAKAFGVCVGATQMLGIGWPARWESSPTIRYSSGCSCAVTGYACIWRRAILSEFQ